MVANNGNPEGLFRSGFMQSGAVIPVGDITHGQPFFDMVVQNAGCAKSRDKIECLRSISAEKFAAAVNSGPSFVGFRVSQSR